MTDSGNSFYKFDNRYRGRALIIVNEKFWKYEGEQKKEILSMKRKGSSVDCKKMKGMFKSLDFKVKLFKDLTAEKMREKIQKASQDDRYNKQSDCFVLVISSHGEELEEKKVPHLSKGAEVWRHCVLGSDCLPLYIDDMMNNFKDDLAKELEGKPKIFFIQACKSRHGSKTKVFDYGVEVKVATEDRLQNTQPTDAGDQGDSGVLKAVGDHGSVEDVNADWIDEDEDEWTGVETDSDDGSCIDSDEDISDAKPAPDSGYLPPSPSPSPPPTQDMELGIPVPTTSQAQQLPAPTLPTQGEQPVKPALRSQGDQNPEQLIESYQDISDAGGDPDSGKMPPSPSEQPGKPIMPSSGEPKLPKGVAPTTSPAAKSGAEGLQGAGEVLREVKPGTKHSEDTGFMPPSPFDIVPINCPRDCVLVYPVTSGYMAFRRADLGSRLLHCMHKEENLRLLMEGCDFLQYMTCITGDMARVEIRFKPDKKSYTARQIKELKENMPFKVTTTVVHRLRGKVYFKPKTDKSIMSAVVKRFKEMFKRN